MYSIIQLWTRALTLIIGFGLSWNFLSALAARLVALRALGAIITELAGNHIVLKVAFWVVENATVLLDSVRQFFEGPASTLG